jgi:hypothetical protein
MAYDLAAVELIIQGLTQRTHPAIKAFSVTSDGSLADNSKVLVPSCGTSDKPAMAKNLRTNTRTEGFL